jgi:tRNA(fMet)-specific endonuclease VapC
MKSYPLDSNALSDCMFHRKGVDRRVDEARARGDRLGTAMPIVAELLAGIEASVTRDKNLPVVNRNLKLFRLWPFDLAAAREYARLFAELKRGGIRMQSIDLMIAAIAMVVPNCTVVTSDSDLGRVPELRVENWVE